MIEVKQDFRTRLETAMTLRGIRPVDLSKATNIPEATISQYRSGYAKPKEKRLAIIADALRVDPSWLMGLDVPMEIRRKHPGEAGGMAEMEMLYRIEAEELISCLSLENQKKAISYLTALLDLQKREEALK